MCVWPRETNTRPKGAHSQCWDGKQWAAADFGDMEIRLQARPVVGLRVKNPRVSASEARRSKFLEDVRVNGSIQHACDEVPVSYNAYAKWRKQFPQFAAEVDLARGIARGDRIIYTADFATFRRNYFGMETTWFQHRAAKALDEAKQGEIILLLWPPEHGKTSLVEDYIGYRLALDAHARITVVSERKEHATKILRRVKNRMEPDGPCPDYVHKFGPFAPDEKDGKRAGAQPWANDHFDVRLRGQFDERDYSCAAVGVNTAIQGQRADWLIIDDCQSLKSLNLTNDYVEKLRQDFFSRPGMFGRICLLGTRVGNEDVYETLIEAGLIDKLIVFPAYRDTPEGEREWLWPERYTAEMYEGMRKRVGEQAWARNYMQRPSAAKDSTFDRDMVAGCHNDARSVIADCPREGGNMTRVCVSLDPSLGNANAITALGFHTKRLLYLSSRVDYGLTRNEQIFDLLEQTVIRWNNPGVSRVHEIVIEANAFQRGLLDDDRIREIIRRYGVRVVPHTTTVMKNDPDIGIPSMALSFMRGEIDLPFSDKPSRDEVALFTEELCAWRPFRRGNVLRQDRVMSFYFGFLRWRSQRMATHVDVGQFSSKGSPLRQAV